MDRLPVELITPICFLACTDGGPTACALSLVSHHIRAASRPARFYSVSFNGPRVITAVPPFLTRLKEEHEETRRGDAPPRVRHLFVSVSPPKGESQTMILKVYRVTIDMLLRAVAQDVETLSLVQSYMQGDQSANPIALDVKFPRLRELTISGVLFSSPQLDSAPFPTLRRLHVLRGPSPSEWAPLTPNVTYLRISEVPDLHVLPVIWTSGLSTFGRDPNADSAEAEEHYPHLQQIIVQPAPHTHFHRLDFYKRYVHELWDMQPTARVPMYLVPADEDAGGDPWNKSEFARVKAKNLWLAAVEGSGRCWQADDKYAHFNRTGDDLPLYLRQWSEEPINDMEAPPIQDAGEAAEPIAHGGGGIRDEVPTRTL
ncbi:hypothetical protein BD310DRAFT_911232 [Dichomitus squalens]|uniref:F-box domain-containing protein n=1 Tax=Dichomitus squalens TaxID=114155 RepID=A0A4V2K9W3_9APHY|nr:hypothetical protein BD310DRAFT_911232 [Dichomitus squalens]